MDVFLVPLGPDRHELYCEVPYSAPADEGPRGRGFVRGPIRKFREMLAAAEREQKDAGAIAAARAARRRSGFGRLRDRAMRLVAQSIAEQRLLWHLRRCERVTLFHPDDLPAERARTIMRASLRRDHDRHRIWLVIDAVALALTGLLTPIPGPNLVAYYFAFRVVGHYLSMWGARQGLHRVAWTAEPSQALRALREALALGPAQREERVREIAADLALPHLARFLQRTAIRTA